MPPKDKYSDPKLRDQIKRELHNSDKGGAPGQWSARKAQMMASEYKKRGGTYTTDKEHGQSEQQKHLDKWTEEEWQTKEGSGNAKKEDGTQKRYLPKKAWEKMDKEEKEETEEKKQQGSKKGNQYVANTGKAKDSKKEASEEAQTKGDDRQNKAASETNVREAEKASGRQTRSNNRKRDPPESGNSQPAPSKKQKPEASSKSKIQQSKGTMGSKHDSAEEPAAQGSVERLPKVGQRISWKAMPGWVHGKVTEVVTSNKSVYGKSLKASENDPRIALEADSGKGCVHKVESCYYD